MPTPLLHFDGAAGISGDMTLGALVDLGVPVEALRDGLASLRLPDWSLEAARVQKHGLRATKVRVTVHGQEEGPPDHDRHDAPASHHHPEGHGRSWAEIRDRIAASELPPRARDAALAVFRRLCEVEAEIHGVTLDDIHLHEVGADDALVDICGSCLALECLGWPEVSAAPPDLGGGAVRTAHGLLPVPSPATLRLLEGRPVTSSGIPVELTTPTGAALLAVLVKQWGPMPAMVVERSGLGAGTRDLADRPNVLRATLGVAADPRSDGPGAHVLVEADIDDGDAQLLAAFAGRAREAGALDVTLSPVTMKKGRLGTRVGVLAPASARDPVVAALFRETTTIGCRIIRVERAECERVVREVETAYGPIRVKIATWRGRAVNAKPEHDDCLAAASRHAVPLKDVVVAAAAAARQIPEPIP